MKEFRETYGHFDRLIKQTKKVYFVHTMENKLLK